MPLKKLKKTTQKIDFSKVDIIDFSTVDQYLGCAEQLRRVREQGPQTPSIALIDGSANHEALAMNNFHKRKKGKDLSHKKLQDKYMSTIEEKTKKFKKKDWEEETKDKIFKRAKVWYPEYIRKHAPNIKPEWVEQPIIHPVNVDGMEFKIAGVVDLTTEDSVPDYKTVKSVKSQSEADQSMQLSLYSAVTGKLQTGFYCFVKSANPYVAFVKSTRTPAQHAWAFQVAKRALEGIRMGYFPYSVPSAQNWRCSEKFCGFWDDCRGKYEKMAKVVLK